MIDPTVNNSCPPVTDTSRQAGKAMDEQKQHCSLRQNSFAIKEIRLEGRKDNQLWKSAENKATVAAVAVEVDSYIFDAYRH